MIRVVVVDDSVEVVSNIERLLSFEPDLEVVGTANDGEAGLQVVRETHPDVVLIDINMPGMDGLTTAATISASMPATQVIMMSVQDDLDYVRRAMIAGARDYLLKPLDIDDAAAKIRQVYEMRKSKLAVAAAAEEPVLGKVITVFSPRGGSGCTTLAINLALALRAFTKRKVVVVDGALQFGDVGVMLNLHGTRTIADLAVHVEEMDASFASEMTIAHQSGIRALLAPPKPENAELVSADAVRRILQALRHSFDLVVVDGGHVLNDLLLGALDESDELLLLTTPDIPAIKSAGLMLEVLDALGFAEEKRALLVSMAGRRYGVKVEDIERSLGCKALATIPYDDAGPILAANQGRPMYETDPEAPLCQAVLAVAHKLTAKMAGGEEPPAEPPKPKGKKVFSLWGHG